MGDLVFLFPFLGGVGLVAGLLLGAWAGRAGATLLTALLPGLVIAALSLGYVVIHVRGCSQSVCGEGAYPLSLLALGTNVVTWLVASSGAYTVARRRRPGTKSAGRRRRAHGRRTT